MIENERGGPCICWWCEQRATVLLEINSLGSIRRAWFCEKDAADFERNCWTRVEAGAGEQMTLDLG